MADEERIVFGQRGLRPSSPPPLPALEPPRRLSSRTVTVGVAGALMFGAYAMAEQAQPCPPNDPDDPNAAASSCHSGWSGHSGGSWGHGGSWSHGVSFGGFGGAGHGHGGGGGE